MRNPVLSLQGGGRSGDRTVNGRGGEHTNRWGKKWHIEVGKCVKDKKGKMQLPRWERLWTNVKGNRRKSLLGKGKEKGPLAVQEASGIDGRVGLHKVTELGFPQNSNSVLQVGDWPPRA